MDFYHLSWTLLVQVIFHRIVLKIKILKIKKQDKNSYNYNL